MSPAKAAACSDLLKILADETRLAVVRQLMAGPQFVNQLNDSLQLEQSLLSHHLKVLRLAGLVTARRDGKAVRYELAAAFRSQSAQALDLGCCSISFDPHSEPRSPA